MDDLKPDTPNGDVKPNVNSNLTGAKPPKDIDLTVDLYKLTMGEMLEISPVDIEDDFIVPVELAAKLKGVSVQAIYKAINSGKLKKISGVLLSSLNSYRVDRARKGNGKLAKAE